MAKGGEEEARKKALEERQKREAKDKADREEQERQKQVRHGLILRKIAI